MTNHTKLPWSFNYIPYGGCQIKNKEKSVARGLGRDNAKFIVKAVNNHYQLVKLLKETLIAIPKPYITLVSDIQQALKSCEES